MNDQNSDIIKKELVNQVFDLKDAEKIQIEYSSLLRKEESVYLNLDYWHSINRVAAVDLTYFLKDEIEYGIACAVLWDFKSNQLEEAQFYKDQVKLRFFKLIALKIP